MLHPRIQPRCIRWNICAGPGKDGQMAALLDMCMYLYRCPRKRLATAWRRAGLHAASRNQKELGLRLDSKYQSLPTIETPREDPRHETARSDKYW